MSNNPVIDPIRLTEQLHAWEAKWDAPLQRWLAVNRTEQEAFAQMIEHTPDLLRLIVNLIKDPNLADDAKTQLHEIAQYVLEARDRIPEADLGVVGLVDDAVKMVVALDDLIGQYMPEIRLNWAGAGDIIDIIDHIYKKRKLYLKDEE